jgi:hypothetical protein
MADSSLSIRIRYLLIDELDWHERILSHQEYFDDDDEGYALDSVPRFDHADAYLDISGDRLRRTELVVRDSRTDATFSVTETFWSGGANRVIEIQDSRDSYWELMVSISRGSEIELVRYGDVDGTSQLISHVTFRNDEETVNYSILDQPGRRRRLGRRST